jgi:hypothetical protein
MAVCATPGHGSTVATSVAGPDAGPGSQTTARCPADRYATSLGVAIGDLRNSFGQLNRLAVDADVRTGKVLVTRADSGNHDPWRVELDALCTF